jgi:acyl-CoA hydrolase
MAPQRVWRHGNEALVAAGWLVQPGGMSSSPMPGSAPRVRRPDDSFTTMTEYVLPTHANVLGNVFGGQIMAWMDLCAAICCQRHAGSICVTVGIDDMHFEQPIQVGQVVVVKARVTAAFRSSLEILVEVHGEDAPTGRTWPCVSAFFTFVSVDREGRPAPVPPLAVASDEEQRLQEAAHERRQHRLLKRLH